MQFVFETLDTLTTWLRFMSSNALAEENTSVPVDGLIQRRKRVQKGGGEFIFCIRTKWTIYIQYINKEHRTYMSLGAKINARLCAVIFVVSCWVHNRARCSHRSNNSLKNWKKEIIFIIQHNYKLQYRKNIDLAEYKHTLGGGGGGDRQTDHNPI